MRTQLVGLLASGVLVATSGAIMAHHSFAMFDKDNPIELEGTVQEFKYINPHSFILLQVKDQDGGTTIWNLEGGAPNALVRDGWTSTALKPGDRIILTIAPLRSGAPGGSWSVDKIKFKDGQMQERIVMRDRASIAAITLTAALALALANAGAQAFDETRYPNWTGQWRRPAGVGNQWDTGKPVLKQEAPMTAEYQAIFEANLADQAAGGQGTDPTYTCIPDGMPRAMNVIFPMEIIIQPKVTHIIIEYLSMLRRIYTDGRVWPTDKEPSFMGYSIGKWIDEDGDGRYDLLEVETRDLKGPRAFDASGIPLHADNQTIIKERIYLDKANSNILHDEVTTIDHALTRPWTVIKSYDRVPNPIWVEAICAEGNQHVRIGSETYVFSADGLLMPAKKNQPPPDLKYFKQSRK